MEACGACGAGAEPAEAPPPSAAARARSAMIRSASDIGQACQSIRTAVSINAIGMSGPPSPTGYAPRPPETLLDTDYRAVYTCPQTVRCTLRIIGGGGCQGVRALHRLIPPPVKRGRNTSWRPIPNPRGHVEDGLRISWRARGEQHLRGSEGDSGGGHGPGALAGVLRGGGTCHPCPIIDRIMVGASDNRDRTMGTTCRLPIGVGHPLRHGGLRQG